MSSNRQFVFNHSWREFPKKKCCLCHCWSLDYWRKYWINQCKQRIVLFVGTLLSKGLTNSSDRATHMLRTSEENLSLTLSHTFIIETMVPDTYPLHLGCCKLMQWIGCDDSTHPKLIVARLQQNNSRGELIPFCCAGELECCCWNASPPTFAFFLVLGFSWLEWIEQKRLPFCDQSKWKISIYLFTLVRMVTCIMRPNEGTLLITKCWRPKTRLHYRSSFFDGDYEFIVDISSPSRLK